jgi:hypothetical protein
MVPYTGTVSVSLGTGTGTYDSDAERYIPYFTDRCRQVCRSWNAFIVDSVWNTRYDGCHTRPSSLIRTGAVR